MKYIPEFLRNMFRKEPRTSGRIIGLGDYRGDHNPGNEIYPVRPAESSESHKTKPSHAGGGGGGGGGGGT